jgi:predicted dithiol-disulfide oxidoreductase (DUF899 family)
LELSELIERVATLRRTLPVGPLVPDYASFDGDRSVRLSQLFAPGQPYLIMYHVMYWHDDEEFCPKCSMWVDGWDAIAEHVEQRANIVATSDAPFDKLQAWAALRGWRRIRVLADADAALARDTGARDSAGDPVATVLVFEKTAEGVRHVYTVHADAAADVTRGLDQYCVVWPLLDLLPSVRGDFSPSNDYVTTP